MARITPIRISENDKTEHARLVRNARAKISRTVKKHDVDLSNEIKLPKIEEFTTRKEFNEWKEKAGSFTNRYNLRYQYVTNDYGVTATKSDINAQERRRKIVQRNARKEIKRVQDNQVYHKGEPMMTVGQYDSLFSENQTGVNVPSDFNFKQIRRQKTFNEMVKVDKKRVDPDHYNKRMSQMQANFLDSLWGSFESDAQPLADRLKELTPEQFFDLYIQNTEFDFDEWDSEGIHISGKVDDIQNMIDIFDNWDFGESNKDLKPF